MAMRLLYIYAEEFIGTRAREVHTIHRVHSLARAGIRVDLIVGTSPQFRNAESLLKAFGLSPHPNLEVTFLSRRFRLGPISFLSSRGFYHRVQSWIEKNGPFDCAYVIHLKAAEYLLQHGPELPVIFEAHEMFADSHPELSAKFKALTAQENQIYQNCAAVVATSHYLANCLDDRYQLYAPVCIIPNSVDEKFLDVPISAKNPHKLIYVGSFQRWKGVDIAVDAMRELPEFHLDVFGGTPGQIAEHRVVAPGNVTFHGHQGHGRIRLALAESCIALLPNRIEPRSSLYTFPMKLLEYAAAGQLIVASDLPVLRELGLGEWATIVEPEDIGALAKAVRDFRNDPVLREQARAWTRSFTWSKQAAQLREFLEKTIAPRAK
jgi:glycosyltransferase involved in cell wall biosynthesis